MNLRDELQKVYDEHGYLNPRLLVDLARAEDHPLHAAVFNKTADEAAEAYYLGRAHSLIRSVKVVYREPTETDAGMDVRAWQAVRTNDERQYVYEPSDKIAADPFLTAMTLREMERRWKELHRQFGRFTEFVSMVRGDVEETAA